MEFNKDELEVIQEALGRFIDRMDGIFGYDAAIAQARELVDRIEENR